MRVLLLVAFAGSIAEFAIAETHPSLRRPAPALGRARTDGPARFVDARAGHDDAAGTEAAPWRTLRHALGQLAPGDTLYLRGGVYYENVYLALTGTAERPITLQSFPGEAAVIDGGVREFVESPATAWEPFSGGGAGEFRSVRRFPNERHFLGSFADSRIGLQSYYHAIDLRADNELVDWEDWNRTQETDLRPLYCGPGLWLDRQSGHLHVRLAPTHLPSPVPNYAGESDPRRVPLHLAPFRSTPLHLDRAEHVRLRDLEIRGAGYVAVLLDHAVDVSFDNVTIWAGAYGLRATATGPLRVERCGLYGNVAPWTFRGDGSKRDYPGRPHRNLSRLNTHALVEIESGRESSVYATPQNDRWEFAWCDFTDAHDGVYLGGIHVRFHHNLLDNLQDDGLYLSPMYLRHRLDKTDPQIRIEQNLFRGMLTALAFGGPEPATRDQVFVTRNVFDLRHAVPTGRPTKMRPEPGYSFGKVIGDHGSPPWSAMSIYHNTFVMREPSRDAAMGTYGSNGAGHPRRVFNNLFLHAGRLPGLLPPDPQHNAAADGDWFWVLPASPGAPPMEPNATAFFARFRSSPQFAASKTLYAEGSLTNGQVADPRLRRLSMDARDEADFRLAPDSPTLDAGVRLPGDWPDPLREVDAGRPDLGALPRDAVFSVGRAASRK